MVRELYGVIVADGVDGGFVVASGNFTREAEAFAKGKNIKLVSGREIIRRHYNENLKSPWLAP